MRAAPVCKAAGQEVGMPTVPDILTPGDLVSGVFPTTRIATPQGWRAAACLRPGQVVLTRGAGPLRLAAVEPRSAPLWVLDLPEGALGNRVALRLPPGQALLVETDLAEPLTGAPFALIPAQALEGWRQIECQPNAAAPLGLRLEAADLVHAGPGMALGLPGAGGATWPEVPGIPLMPLPEARALVARLVAEDLGAVLAQAAMRGAWRP
jgi:hypothetical protein